MWPPSRPAPHVITVISGQSVGPCSISSLAMRVGLSHTGSRIVRSTFLEAPCPTVTKLTLLSLISIVSP